MKYIFIIHLVGDIGEGKDRRGGGGRREKEEEGEGTLLFLARNIPNLLRKGDSSESANFYSCPFQLDMG